MSVDYLTADDVAERLAVAKVDTVYRLIASGALAAVNVAAGTGRPSWRIPQSALARFVESRTATPAVKVAARRKVRRPAVTRYF